MCRPAQIEGHSMADVGFFEASRKNQKRRIFGMTNSEGEALGHEQFAIFDVWASERG